MYIVTAHIIGERQCFVWQFRAEHEAEKQIEDILRAGLKARDRTGAKWTFYAAHRVRKVELSFSEQDE